jgi:putative DNA methylase
MGEGSELHQSTLRAVLYAMMELEDDVDGSDVLAHLVLNIPNYYGDPAKRETAINIADYIMGKLHQLRPGEASSARVLGELLKNQRLG